jgi:class 3 adenylate cyclase/predicted ATPase
VAGRDGDGVTGSPAVTDGWAGTLTVLFTDIEGSTRLWERHHDAMEPVVRAHNELIAELVRDAGGRVLQFKGDGAVAVFARAADAVGAAVDIQRAFLAASFPPVGTLRVREALHTGWCRIAADGTMYGRPGNLASRLEAAAHGGQIVASNATVEAVRKELRPDEHFFNLGRYHMRGFDEPVIVHAVMADGLRADFPPLRTPYRGFDELPPDDQPLYDREEVVEHILRSLAARRMVGVWGPAGVGKTRVVQRVAARARRPYDDGVRFVDLATLDDPDGLDGAIAAALRAQPAGGEADRETILRTLRSSRLLLILDDCDGVIGPVRALVLAVGLDCPGVHVLTTSRQKLDVPAGATVEVSTLSLPAAGERDAERIADSPAVRLFRDAARAVDPGFILDRSTAPDVATVCRAVDGLPLALELAAARLDVESLDELAADPLRMTQGLGVSRRGRAREALDPLTWAAARLTTEETDLYRALAVFAGPFRRPMALRMASDEWRGGRDFDRLVRMSLVVRDPVNSGRFRLLAAARQHARYGAGGQFPESLRSRHAHLMLERAETLAPQLHTSDERRCCEDMRADFADYGIAMQHFTETGLVVEAARLVTAVFDFAVFQARPEAHRWAAMVAAVIADDTPGAAEVVGAAALGAWYAGDIDAAIRLGLRATDIADRNGGWPIWARMALVNAYGYAGALGDAASQMAALITELRSREDPFWEVDALSYIAIGLTIMGDFEGAQRRAERALTLAKRIGNPDCVQFALHALGRALAPTDPRAACDAFELAIAASGEVESRFNVALALGEWVRLKRQSGHIDEAVAGARDLLEMIAASGNRSQLSQALREGALVLSDAGHPHTAALVLLARRGLPQMPLASFEAEEEELCLARLTAELGMRWSRVEMEARVRSESEIVGVCRAQLSDLVAAGVGPSRGG